MTNTTMPVTGSSVLVQGWGRATGSNATVVSPHGDDEWAAALAQAGPRGLIARGGGCGYGDAAQNAGGLVARTTTARTTTARTTMSGIGIGIGSGIGAVDAGRASVSVDAGVPLGVLLRRLAATGWTLPVVPGTAAVTVGGAIAADVHGKNHLRAGTFGAHVHALTLLTAAQGVITIGPRTAADAFWATVGGLGLTGVILRADLHVVPLASWWMQTTEEAAPSLAPLLDRLRAAAESGEHAVAWVDAHRRGRSLGAGVVTRADPVAAPGGFSGAGDPHGRPTKIKNGFSPYVVGRGIAWPPIAALANRGRRLAARARPRRRIPLPALHFPLDAVPQWPALHGRRGLIQHQFTVPFGAEDVLAEALTAAQRAGRPPSLAVLKVFGAAGPAPLSFPQPGWSLALDFAAEPALGPVLDRLDERIAAAGGRVYLVKDSRLRPAVLRRMYPDLPRWKAERAVLDPDGRFGSDLSRRLRLTDHLEALDD